MSAAIEARNLPVVRRIQLGPTNIVRAAIIAGQIDVYTNIPATARCSSTARPIGMEERGRRHAEVKLDSNANRLVARPGTGQHLGMRSAVTQLVAGRRASPT